MHTLNARLTRYPFILLGHETTAHTLAFALTLLALYPEHQEVLYQEANDSFGSHTSNYSDYSSLVNLPATQIFSIFVTDFDFPSSYFNLAVYNGNNSRIIKNVSTCGIYS